MKCGYTHNIASRESAACPYLTPLYLTAHRCLAHVVNLAVVDFISHITKIAIVESSTAIWEYDPTLKGNRVLNSSLDVISAIRMLTIKVSPLPVSI
jgi:hypothetical protein